LSSSALAAGTCRIDWGSKDLIAAATPSLILLVHGWGRKAPSPRHG
jgi:hypothetical protein